MTPFINNDDSFKKDIMNDIGRIIQDDLSTFFFRLSNRFDEGQNLFDEHKNELLRVYQETQSMIEATLYLPANPFTSEHFKGWLDSLLFSKFTCSIEVKNYPVKPDVYVFAGAITRRSNLILFEVTLHFLVTEANEIKIEM